MNAEKAPLDLRYQQAMDYLFSFVDYSLVNQQVFAATKFELGRIFALAVALGNPQQAYPSIHIAGSKGKGSTSALCAAALTAQGYRVGLYTSPHLSEYEERIQINGLPISRQELTAFIEEIKPYVAAVPGLTTFEITTVLAFWYFARQKVDVAVIEVGLGGRLDPTNIVTPAVSVITSLQLEHTLILGDTLEKIAGEKAGIIKPRIPVVSAPQANEARQVLVRVAGERSAPLIEVGRDYTFQAGAITMTEGQYYQPFSIQKAHIEQTPVALKTRLLGPHQVENAAVAYAALQTLSGRGTPVDDRAIRTGFAQAAWPGRFEILPSDPPLVIDAAHTPVAAQKLVETMRQVFDTRPVVLVFGASEDKNVREMLQALAPLANRMIFTRANHPRAMSVENLLADAQGLGAAMEGHPEVAAALQKAQETAQKNHGVVLVTGSIFVAGSAREAWKARP